MHHRCVAAVMRAVTLLTVVEAALASLDAGTLDAGHQAALRLLSVQCRGDNAGGSLAEVCELLPASARRPSTAAGGPDGDHSRLRRVPPAGNVSALVASLNGPGCAMGCTFANATMTCNNLSPFSSTFVRAVCQDDLTTLADCCLTRVNLDRSERRPAGSAPDDGLGALLTQLAAMPLVSALSLSGNAMPWSGALGTARALGGRLEHLELLRMSSEPLEADSFAATPNLRLLRLVSCNLTAVPEGVFHSLTRLAHLTISDNAIPSLAAGILDSTLALSELVLEGNGLDRVDAGLLSNLAALEQFHLAGNRITELPKGFLANNGRLKTLSLSSNRIDYVSQDHLSPLSNLEYLNMRDNHITALPADLFSSQSNLVRLGIDSNRLSSLPAGIFDPLSSIVFLYMDSNNILDLPPGLFDKLTSLGTIFMGLNPYPSLRPGEFVGLTNLEELACTTGGLTSLPKDVFQPMRASLKYLNLEQQAITELPPGIFSGMSSLVVLRMSINRVTALPAGLFDDLTSLTMLGFAENEVQAFPSGLFDHLTSLAVLAFPGNRVTAVMPDVFAKTPSISVLDASSNALSQDLSEIVGSLSTLASLNVSFNRGLTLKSQPWRRLSTLQTLDVSGTLTTLDGSMCQDGSILMARAMVNTTDDELRAVLNTCLQLALVLDLSNNPAMNNLTLLRSFLQPFSTILPMVATDDYGNEHIPALQMFDSPTSCQLVQGYRTRPLPKELVGEGYQPEDTQYHAPVLEYVCDCSPSYVVSHNLCVPYWSATRIAVITVSTVLAVIGLLAYVTIPLYRRRRRRMQHSLEVQQLLLQEADQELDHIRNTWRLEWSDVDVERVIGKGAFGDVYHATWMGRHVACKRLKESLVDLESMAFEAEAAVMSTLRHPNIVTFYGAGIDDTGRGFLVTELMKTGSLRNLLHDVDSHPSLAWAVRLGFAADVAHGLAVTKPVAGMMFLHSRSPPMLHRDLKSDNVLLDEAWAAKVADFGTLRALSAASGADAIGVPFGRPGADLTMTATGGAGTPLWAAPEVTASRHGRSHYGMAADVYSFGIVLFEIATRQLPYDHVKGSGWKLRELIENGERPRIPEDTLVPQKYCALMESCWRGDASQRPTFPQVAEEIHQQRVALERAD